MDKEVSILSKLLSETSFEIRYESAAEKMGNVPVDRRANLEGIPLAGISNPDVEIQDLSVKCFEAWEDKKYSPMLINLRDGTDIWWFKTI